VVVGFDLDMTLVDSRPGIAATYRELVRETGVPIDVELVVSRLGPPLELELANWYPLDDVAAAAGIYRERYPDFAIAPSPALPGAAAAIDAVRQRSGRVVVVTAKKSELARLHLDHLGLSVDALYGLAWADGKADALREAGAGVYVGDHVADIRAARSAGAVPVGVPTGGCPAEELAGAGAHVVLPDLRAFPAWLAGIQLGSHGQRD
jgi:phosphoglycolate phosphatase